MSVPNGKPLRLYATTRIQRNVAAHEVGNAIAQIGGEVFDHYAYSNIALAAHFSLPQQGMAQLSDQLRSRRIRLASGSEASLREGRLSGSSGDDADVAGSLNLRFIHDEPDLKRRVLPVPG